MTTFQSHFATCRCGATYYRDRVWKFLCLDCWKKSKRQEEARATQPKEIIKIVEVPSHPIEPDMLRRLVQLCHPDKHGGSEAANIATRYLLELRGQHG